MLLFNAIDWSDPGDLYGDFKADQCVVITEPTKFIQRVCETWHQEFGDELIFSSIEYIDPYLGNGDQAFIPFAKPLRYFYQSEVRFVGLQATDSPKELEPRMLTIGSIEDIAELVIT